MKKITKYTDTLADAITAVEQRKSTADQEHQYCQQQYQAFVKRGAEIEKQLWGIEGELKSLKELQATLAH